MCSARIHDPHHPSQGRGVAGHGAASAMASKQGEPAGERTDLGLAPALALGLSVAICHGIGRFAYALLMPAMMAELQWTYEQASWINTANAMGYLAGTFTGLLLLRRYRAASLFTVGVLVTCASVAFMAWRLGFWWFVLLRILSGIGAAWAFSTGGALIAAIYAPDPGRKGTATALFFGSAGIGMIATGALVPALLEFQGEPSWSIAWMCLGVFCFLLAPLSIHASRRGVLARPDTGAVMDFGLLRASWVSLVGYFGFAAAHTGYIFFIFAWTRAEALPWQHGAGMWIVLGVGILLSSRVWAGPMTRWPGPRILAACCLAVAIGTGVPLLHVSIWTVYLSALLVGVSLFIAPSAMAVLARQSLPQPFWSAGLMVFSIVFSIGQSLASWGFGWAADRYPLRAILATSTAGLLIASMIAVLDRRRFG